MLLKYYNAKPDIELAALNALEELMDELQHPSSKLTATCCFHGGKEAF